jgi:hypothetical protein
MRQEREIVYQQDVKTVSSSRIEQGAQLGAFPWESPWYRLDFGLFER